MKLNKDKILDDVMNKSKGYWQMKLVHSSGHGGQHKDHGNSKAQLKFDVDKFFKTFDLDDKRDKFVEVFGKKHIHHDNRVVILENQEQRSAKINEENVLKYLRHMLSKVLEEEKDRIKTKVPKYEKRKRLDDKKYHSKKKEHRKKPDVS